MKVSKQSIINSSLLKHFPQPIKPQHPITKQSKTNNSFTTQANSFRQNKFKTAKPSPEQKNNLEENTITEEKEPESNSESFLKKNLMHNHYKTKSNYVNFTNPIYMNRALAKKKMKKSNGNTSNSLSSSLSTSMPKMIQMKNIKLIIPFNCNQNTGKEKKAIESSRISHSKANLSLTKNKSLNKYTSSKLVLNQKKCAQTAKNSRKNSKEKSQQKQMNNQQGDQNGNKNRLEDMRRGSASTIRINVVSNNHQQAHNIDTMKDIKKQMNTYKTNLHDKLKKKTKNVNSGNNTLTKIGKTANNSKSKSKPKQHLLINDKEDKNKNMNDPSSTATRLLKKMQHHTSTNSPVRLIDKLKPNGINKLNSNHSINKLIINIKKKDMPSKQQHGRNNNEFELANTSMMSTMRDSHYYLRESECLANYIKDYYRKNKEYPKTNLSFYKYGRIIGRGAFGKVNLGLNVLTGQLVAIKSLNKKSLLNEHAISKKKILYETNLMRNLQHSNITKILETFESDKYILIIMEYISGGNLHSFVKKRRKLTEKTAKILFKQIIEGLKYIHSKHIVHRDIKLENILIDLDNNIKICDFGVGKMINPNEVLTDQCGTPIYMAPEIMKNIGYKGFPVDVWSSGIALYIMLSGNIPFNRVDIYDLKHSIIHNQLKPIEDISKEANDLLLGLLEKDPTKRLTTDQILKHKWLDDEYDSNDKTNLNKYHLFTNAEMALLSKNHVDYRNGNPHELIENFTMRNLITIEDTNHQNIMTKSNILAPYNSYVTQNDSEEIPQKNSLNSDLQYGNDLIKFRGKMKELNMNYELNNNEEIDNGIVIDMEGDVTDINKNPHLEEKVISISHRLPSYKIPKDDNQNNHPTNVSAFPDEIIKNIGEFGYKRDFIIQSLQDNILCSATAAYYLLLNHFNLHS